MMKFFGLFDFYTSSHNSKKSNVKEIKEEKEIPIIQTQEISEEDNLNQDNEMIAEIEKKIKSLKKYGYCKVKFWDNSIRIINKSECIAADIGITKIDTTDEYISKFHKIQAKDNRLFILTCFKFRSSFYSIKNAEKAMDLIAEYVYSEKNKEI